MHGHIYIRYLIIQVLLFYNVEANLDFKLKVKPNLF